MTGPLAAPPSPLSPSASHRSSAVSSSASPGPAATVSSGSIGLLPRVIITIDGPAGTGKSSVARILARRLGLEFLDTGAMYRAAAALALDRALDLNDHQGIEQALAATDLHFEWKTDPPTLYCGGVSVMHRIRAADVTSVVSPIAGIPGLRRQMVRMQREIAAVHPRLVTEGRDQGSVVFPDANVKIYLDASAQVRAARRADQLRSAGQSVDLASLTSEIQERDRSDSTRHDGPLICPPTAVRVDTSSMNFDEVVSTLERLVVTQLGVVGGAAARPPLPPLPAHAANPPTIDA